MSKFTLYHLNIIANYIYDKHNYLKLMCVNKKCGLLPKYLNQFDAFPPFEDMKLFKQHYKYRQFKTFLITQFYNGFQLLNRIEFPKNLSETTVNNRDISNLSYEYLENTDSIKTIYLRLNDSHLQEYVRILSKPLQFPNNQRRDLYQQLINSFFNFSINDLYHYFQPSINVETLIPSKSTIEFDYPCPYTRGFIREFHNFISWFSFKDIIIPNSVTKIGSYALSRLTQSKIGTITLPMSIKCINYGAFENSFAIKQIIIPNAITKIGNNAFNGCCNLNKINIPSSVVIISSYAFKGCYNLTSLTIPQTLKKLGKNIIDHGFKHDHKIIYIPNKFNKIRLYKTKNKRFFIDDQIIYY